MKLTIKAEGINDDGIKVLTKAVKRLYKPYIEHYIGSDSFEIKIGDEEMKPRIEIGETTDDFINGTYSIIVDGKILLKKRNIF